MERLDNLLKRDKVGVDDFVLLEKCDKEEFLTNLRKRFNENIIYSYIGQVLISVNPFKNLNIYDENHIQNYQNANLYEFTPHIYAISDSSYRSMVEEFRDQCILVSGESGSGKTEASKKVLKYLAAISPHKSAISYVKDKLLYSNPVLEAFGNAKTSRNDNSSRFGKYMDITFDRLGIPIGGHINIYLLEKSRVVCLNKNEQNFHIFYQMLFGLDDDTLLKLNLKRDPEEYSYLQATNTSVDLNIANEQKQFEIVKQAFELFNFTEEEKLSIFSIIAAILQLGNTGFFVDENDNEKSVLGNIKTVKAFCQLLECDIDLLKYSLTNRTIDLRGELVATHLNRDQALYARDALAKAIYERLFVWLVERLNTSLEPKENTKSKNILMGLLDIYGFEVFEKNSFEQFCINFFNEKLQQLFITLTLKQEQEEYFTEQIEWEPVEYFDNRIICDLIEERHRGVIAFLDEECLRPGDANDATLLAKLEANLQSNPHFSVVYTKNNRNRQTSVVNEFKISHYAGEVNYCSDGFVNKNNDLLFRDLKKAMCSSKNVILSNLFHLDELKTLKRPATTITQFRQSLVTLIELLSSKEPWYIRCIKPNQSQKPNHFDDDIVRHQIQYLGLMENLRVRRAGFVYRRQYEAFLKRYKCLSPRTWPNFNGKAKDGVQTLVDHFGYQPSEYKMGLTKIFIRSPQTLFRIEEAFQQHKHVIATKIQALYKGYRQRTIYAQIKKSVLAIQAYIRMIIAKRLLEKRRKAANRIRNFVKGFITRHDNPNALNQAFLKQVQINWLNRLSKHLPLSVLDHSWPPAPSSCQEASENLNKLHRNWLVRKYVYSLSPARKEILSEKVLAEKLFKGKKPSYFDSLASPFKSNRLSNEDDELRKQVFEVSFKGANEKTQYSCRVKKYDRHGYKMRERVLIITNKKLYLLETKKLRIKEAIPFEFINSAIISNRMDSLFVIKIPIGKKEKGDLILEYHPLLIELMTKLVKQIGANKLIISDSTDIEHLMADGKTGKITFSDGMRYEISKRKDGALQVKSSVSP